MTKTISYKFCFKENTFNGDAIVSILNNFRGAFGFDCSKYHSSNLGVYDNEDLNNEVLMQISDIKENLRLTIFDSTEKMSMNVADTANRVSCQTITFHLNSELKLGESLVDFLIKNENFIVGYVYDFEFAKWQSEIYPNHYRIFDKSIKNVKMYWNEFFNEYQIDITSNPGRLTLIKGMWLTVSPIMYFGKPMFEYVPIDKILQNSLTKTVVKISEFIVKIILFDNIIESNSQINYDKLREFRNFLKFDDLESKLK